MAAVWGMSVPKRLNRGMRGRGPGRQAAEMYNSAVIGYRGGMTEITVSDARARLADVVDSARVGHDPVYLTRRGQRVAAVIDAEDLDRLIAAAEDLADIEAAAAARAEIRDGEPAIPWEQVKADLGLA
jgi:antitoxin Phd